MTDVFRSILFVPASRPDRFDKALATEADLVCIDLEDAVLPAEKEEARNKVIDFIGCGNSRICVRVNPLNTEAGLSDLAALEQASPEFIMLAKCANKEQVLQCAEKLPNTKIIALIESIEGFNNASSIAAASPLMQALMLGGADMAAQLRCKNSFESLLFVRSQLVVAAASACIELIDVPFFNIKDEQGLVQETERVSDLGFTGKAAIHPSQVEAINRAFAPSADEVAYARKVIDSVSSPDTGVLVVDGNMIDRPIVLACQRILALAERTV